MKIPDVESHEIFKRGSLYQSRVRSKKVRKMMKDNGFIADIGTTGLFTNSCTPSNLLFITLYYPCGKEEVDDKKLRNDVVFRLHEAIDENRGAAFSFIPYESKYN